MAGRAPPDAATRARSGRPAVGRRSRGCPDAGHAGGRPVRVLCPLCGRPSPIGQANVRCPRVRCHAGVRTDGSPVSAALQPRCPDRAGPWNGSVRRAAPVGAMGSTCRRGPRAAWSPARMGSEGRDGAALAVGGSHEGRWRIWAAVSHAHRLRRRLAAWPTRELVQRQGAGRLAGEHENERVLTSPPAGAFGQVVGVMPDHGAGPGGSDHAPWSLGW